MEWDAAKRSDQRNSREEAAQLVGRLKNEIR